ncbi:hypothetical protein DAPPUDRAFT_343624, partial [Daphnia pulex]
MTLRNTTEFLVYCHAGEDELDNNQGEEIEDPSEVVIEEEELGVVEDLSPLDQPLMLGLNDVFLCGEVLGEDLTVILHLLALLGHVWVLHSNDLWLLLIVDFVQFDLLEEGL